VLEVVSGEKETETSMGIDLRRAKAWLALRRAALVVALGAALIAGTAATASADITDLLPTV